jgi:hypothetical protein
MTIIDRLRAIEKQLSEVWKLLMAIRASGGGGGGPHNLLSGTHTDTTAGAPVRGDVIVADSNPKWKKLARAAGGLLLGYDATDVVAINPNTLDVDKVDGSHAAQIISAASTPDADAATKGKLQLTGQLGGSAASPTVTGITETDGPTALAIGDITAGQFLKRSGNTIVGSTMPNYIGINYDPDSYPGSPDAMDDEFDDGDVDDGGGGSLWAIANEPAAFNETTIPGYLYAYFEDTGSATNIANLIRLYQPPPDASIEWSFKIKCAVTGDFSNSSLYVSVGLYIADTIAATPTCVGCCVNASNASTSGRTHLGGVKDNGSGALTPMSSMITRYMDESDFYYLNIRKFGTAAYTSSNRYDFWFSKNGIIWQYMGGETKTFANNCNELGIFIRKGDSYHGWALVDYFRRLA